MLLVNVYVDRQVAVIQKYGLVMYGIVIIQWIFNDSIQDVRMVVCI